MKKIFKVLAVFLVTITLQFCSNDDNDTPIETNTIVDVAVNN